jgi:hypothetical protein
MNALDVIEEPAAAAGALNPIRARLLAALQSPASAAMLATQLDHSRQKLNYYLRTLEQQGLVHVVEERRWGGISERLYVASASSYVISPAALGRVASDPDRIADRLSARYLIALAARVVREVGALVKRADREDKRLATLSLDTEIRFRSAAERAAFTEELARHVNGLVARYHDAAAPGGRPHRLIVAAHPLPIAVDNHEPPNEQPT